MIYCQPLFDKKLCGPGSNRNRLHISPRQKQVGRRLSKFIERNPEIPERAESEFLVVPILLIRDKFFYLIKKNKVVTAKGI